jgi:hypothetical protein
MNSVSSLYQFSFIFIFNVINVKISVMMFEKTKFYNSINDKMSSVLDEIGFVRSFESDVWEKS